MGFRIEYRAPTVQFYINDLLSKNNQQTGSGIVGGLPVFASSHGILDDQFGEGFFSDFILPGLKAIGKQLFSTGTQIIADKIRNPGAKTSTIAKRRLVEGGQSLLDKGYKRGTSFLQEQFGSGCSLAKRRKVTRKPIKRSSKKKITKSPRKSKKRVYKRKRKMNKKAVKKGRIVKKRKYRRRAAAAPVKSKKRVTRKRRIVKTKIGKGISDLDSLFY